MPTPVKKSRKNLQSASVRNRHEGTRTSPPSPDSKPQTPSPKTAPAVAKAQAEFLEDIRVSLQEAKDGKALPAKDALELIELGLDDDELAGNLPQ